MLGENPLFRYGVIAACLCVGIGGVGAVTAAPAPNSQQRMFDRLQEQERQRQQQQLEDMQVPGEGPDLRMPVPEGSGASGRCFEIESVQLKTLGKLRFLLVAGFGGPPMR